MILYHYCWPSWLIAVAILALAGCDRSGPSKNVVDWDIHLDARGAQMIDRWMLAQGVTAHDLFKSTRRTIPAASWLNATPQVKNEFIPDTAVIGPVVEVAAPFAVASETIVEFFDHPVFFVLRDRATGVELVRRELHPGYCTFKTFLDTTSVTEAGFFYRGNLLLVTDLDLTRGRHQTVTIAIQTTANKASGGPSLFGR